MSTQLDSAYLNGFSAGADYGRDKGAGETRASIVAFMRHEASRCCGECGVCRGLANFAGKIERGDDLKEPESSPPPTGRAA